MPPVAMNPLPLFALLISITAALQAEVTIPPKSVNITINKVAVFHCTGVANSFTWRANGQQLDHGEGVTILPEVPVNETLQIYMSTLRMAVTSVNNATNITCVAFSYIPPSIDKSYPAMLLVQGLLESVSNLTAAYINSTTVLISWSPPFALEGVPILGYSVTITNTTSGENITISVEGDATMLYHSFAHTDFVNTFTVTVVPINEVGVGEPAIAPTVDLKASVTSQSLVSTEFTSILQNNNGTFQFTIATPSATINSKAPANDNLTSTSLLITIVTCVVALIIVAVAVAVVVAASGLVLLKKRKTSSSRNRIQVDENPAYEEVTLNKTQFDVQENSAYSTSTYNPYSIVY